MKTYIPTVLAAALALFLGACASSFTDPATGETVTVDTGPGEFLDNLVMATRADAEAALALAEQSGNEAWGRCWATVIVVLDEKGAGAGEYIAVVGPLSALQRASNIYRTIDAGIDERVREACAIVGMDILRFAHRGVGRAIPFVGG